MGCNRILKCISIKKYVFIEIRNKGKSFHNKGNTKNHNQIYLLFGCGKNKFQSKSFNDFANNEVCRVMDLNKKS